MRSFSIGKFIMFSGKIGLKIDTKTVKHEILKPLRKNKRAKSVILLYKLADLLGIKLFEL